LTGQGIHQSSSPLKRKAKRRGTPCPGKRGLELRIALALKNLPEQDGAGIEGGFALSSKRREKKARSE